MYVVTINQDYWTAKNQLQRDIKRQCREHVHGTLLHSKEDRSRWLTWFNQTIQEMWEKSKAKKSIEVDHYLHDDDSMNVYINDTVKIVIYPVRHHFVPEAVEEVQA